MEKTANTTANTEAEIKHKRKTHTSSAVKNRYKKKVYTRILADLPKDMVAEFKKLVAENGTTVSAIMREAVEKYISENKK